jgi:hypothetical protein
VAQLQTLTGFITIIKVVRLAVKVGLQRIPLDLHILLLMALVHYIQAQHMLGIIGQIQVQQLIRDSILLLEHRHLLL